MTSGCAAPARHRPPVGPDESIPCVIPWTVGGLIAPSLGSPHSYRPYSGFSAVPRGWAEAFIRKGSNVSSMIVSGSPEPRPAPVDGWVLREVCGRFLTGVVVITCQGPDAEPVGLTVNSFTSVSLAPPLVLFCVHANSRALAAVRARGAFAVNVLAADQADLCRAFAARETAGFGTVAHRPGPTGSPVIGGSLAYLDCRVRDLYPGGDHQIVLGEVVDLGLLREERPLAFFRSVHPRLEVQP
ncbi:flavin reductase family protein [Micromonospora sp. MS34]|uniref:flavin reductase family protein n=1 Tax=Micromonospora sp. MS34 TaxID=3385971 RepID=UPI0039A2BCE8